MSDCLFSETGTTGIYQCSECDYLMGVPSPYPPDRVHRTCKRKPGFGDFVAWLLRFVPRGLKPQVTGCGCNERQAKLNRLWSFENIARRWQKLKRLINMHP